MMKQSLWALAAAACFSFMAVFVKLCSGHFGSLELVFYRSLIGIVTISMFVRSQGLSLRTEHLGGHIKRAVLGTISVGLWFFTIGEMPLGTNMTLIYTTPLFMAANFIILAFIKKLPGVLFWLSFLALRVSPPCFSPPLMKATSSPL